MIMSLRLTTGLVAVTGVLLLFCGKERQRTTDALSGEQQKLSSVITADTKKKSTPKLLSHALAAVIADEPFGDSAQHHIASFRTKLDSATLLLSSQLFMETDPKRIITAVSDLVFNTWGISFNDNRDSIIYLYPHLVLAKRQGSCVGMSLLYLLIAEKLGVPLYGVRAPGHMFVRFDNSRERYNIETLRKGEVMDDAWYRQRWSITDTGLYSLSNLTVDGVLAVVRYNLGTIFMKQRKYVKASVHLETALQLLSDFPEAQGNLALVYDARGDSERGLQLLTAIRDAHSAFENIDQNIASLQLTCARYTDALATYTGLTTRDPHQAEFHYGMGIALFHLNKMEEAGRALQHVLALQPGHTGARELLQQIKRQVN